MKVDSTDMPKRFWCAPLGQHDDDWLVVWAWLTRRSKSAQASSIIAARIRALKADIEVMLDHTATRLSLTPDELMAKILAGEAENLEVAEDGDAAD